MVHNKCNNCIDCNKPISKRSLRCLDCYILNKKRKISKKEYQKNRRLIIKYGISIEDFDCFWFACKGKCSICGKNMVHETENKKNVLDIYIGRTHKRVTETFLNSERLFIVCLEKTKAHVGW